MPGTRPTIKIGIESSFWRQLDMWTDEDFAAYLINLECEKSTRLVGEANVL
jgi:hypothetical protein